MAGKRQGLTPKQRRFVREYIIDLNATQAAIRAGYTPEWADRVGPRLVGKSRVKRAIREAEEVRVARSETTADRVFRELCLVAFSTVDDYTVDDTGRIRLRGWADPAARRAISSVERTKTTRTRRDGEETEEVKVKLRLWDKNAALKVLSQHFDIIKPKDLPPLEAVFASLPAHVADGLRQLLARKVSDGDGPKSG